MPPAARPSRKVPPSLAIGTVVAGCILLLAGCLLPMAAGQGGLLISHVSGLALVPIAIGTAVTAGSYVSRGGDTWVAVCLAGQLAAVLVLVDVVKVLSGEHGLGSDATPGAGLWAAGVGSLLLFAGGVLLSRARIAVVPPRPRP